MMSIYRLLGFIVTIFSSFLAVVAIYGLFLAASNPGILFQCFLLASVVLYSWLANRFFAQIIMLKNKMTKKQKDWLQVNAIVAFIFSVIGIIGCVGIVTDPNAALAIIKDFPENVNIDAAIITKTGYVLLTIFVILFIHIGWTFLLIRKHKEQFEIPE